jgi:hypothetical protein
VVPIIHFLASYEPTLRKQLGAHHLTAAYD